MSEATTAAAEGLVERPSEAYYNVYVLWIPEDVLLILLGDWMHRDHIRLPVLDAAADVQGRRVAIPQDAHLERATHSWERRAFGLLLSHPSFPAVPEGDVPPSLILQEQTVHFMEAKACPDHVIEARRPEGA